MMATWRGSSGREGGGTAAGRGGRCISGEAGGEGRQRYLDYLEVLEQVVRDAASAAKGVGASTNLRRLKPA